MWDIIVVCDASRRAFHFDTYPGIVLPLSLFSPSWVMSPIPSSGKVGELSFSSIVEFVHSNTVSVAITKIGMTQCTPWEVIYVTQQVAPYLYPPLEP